MHGVENEDSHAKMGVNSQCVQPLCCLLYVCIHGLAVVEACGGLQGFTRISVQCTTWEPGVEGYYLAMGPKQRCNRYARAVFRDMALCGITLL